MINNVTLVGRMAKDCDLRYSPSGTAIASFTIACNRYGKDEADFINCVAFKKTAEALANYTKKGSLVGLTGSIQVRTYEKDGRKIWVTEVLANSIQFLEPKGQGNQQNSQQNNSRTEDPFANSKPADDYLDSELPF